MLWSAIPYIKLGMLQNFEIPLPPLATQQLIVAKLDETFAQIDEAIATTQANIDQTDELRKSVLDKVFEEGEWEKVRLNDICEKITDGSHNPPKWIDWWDYKMIASRNIESWVLSFDWCRFLTKEDFDSENKRTDVQTGDVLLSIVWTIGKVYVILESDWKFVMQRSLAVIKWKRNIINSYFLATFFKSPVFQKYINDNAKWAAQKWIYLNSLKELQIPLPPLTKQQEIVSYLDHVFAQSSQLKEQYQKKLVELKELKASVLQSAFEGELV